MTGRYHSSPQTLAAARAKAWETRRAKYGPGGHQGAYRSGRSHRALALIVKLYVEGTLSGGQCCKALNIDRVEWLEIVDDIAPGNRGWA